MKFKQFIIVVVLGLVVHRGNAESTPTNSIVWAEDSHLVQTQRLYLHFFMLGESPHRILTTNIHLGDELDIRAASDTRAGSGTENISGRIEARDGKLFAHLSGQYGTSTGIFEGEVELEKPFVPTGYAMSSMVFLTHFVLSTNSDCKAFLVN